MNERFIFGQYYPSNSWFHRLDPRTKIISIFLFMVATFLVTNVYVLLGFLVAVNILVLSTKVPYFKLLKSLKTVIFILVFTIIFQLTLNTEGTFLYKISFSLGLYSLFISLFFLLLFLFGFVFLKKFKFLLFLFCFAAVLLSNWLSYKYAFDPKNFFTYDIKIYKGGVITSAIILIRIVSLVFLSSIFTFSTKPSELNKGLEKLFKIPVLAMMMSIAIRFIPTLIKEATRILKAQASRGVDFKEASFKHRTKQIISLLVPMFIISHKRAEELAYAMEARGYVPRKKRTSLFELKLLVKDWIFISFSIAVLIAIITLKVLKYV